MKRLLLTAIAFSLFVSTVPSRAQLQLQPVAQEQGQVGLGLMLRKLKSVGIFMHTAAHPDDENNALLAMLSHGRGMRAALVSATRGDGGQNEIGSELFDALAVLRTEELLAAHRFDGAEQHFCRAVDFGYSFSVEETFEKWGRDEILADFVRHIRTIRPDVIVALPSEGSGGGQHHQASSRLTAEAFRAAADPARFPSQLADGLRPWQPKKLYTLASFGFRGEPPPQPGVRLVAVNTDVYDPLLGRTYAEVGTEARSMHKCQGMAQLLALPGAFTPRYRLVDTVIPGQADQDEAFLFDGVDTSVPGLAQYAGDRPPAALTSGLAAIVTHVEAAEAALASGGPSATTRSLAEGLAAVRRLLDGLGAMGLEPEGREEIAFRLRAKEQDFQRAVILAQGLRFEALADDGLLIEGQTVRLRLVAANRGSGPVTLERATLSGFRGDASCAAGLVAPAGVVSCEATAVVTASADRGDVYWHRLPDAARYRFDSDAPFGAPFRPSPFAATFDLQVAGHRVTAVVPIEYRYERDIFAGEKRMGPKVVAPMAVKMTPEIVILPASSASAPAGEAARREVRVTVTNHTKGAARGDVGLSIPQGWSVTPARAVVAFTREDEEQTVRFEIRPASAAVPGEHRITARVEAGAARYERGYQVVEYPHTRRRHLFVEPATLLKVIDVKVAPTLLVGYVMGVGDQVPPAIQQLGARLEFLTGDDLAWGDLGRYDVIVTGVRAYERRDDLRAHNQRLIDYVESGGTLIVQYNKFEFNEAQYGPYPAKVSSNRVTDEYASAKIVVPDHPVFRLPNRIGTDAWSGWVQERGLYFLGEKDPRYADLVELEDSFPNNPGVKGGALVEVRYGKGRWVYVGLGLWRQLPAGTTGAYTLLANLISIGKVSAGTNP